MYLHVVWLLCYLTNITCMYVCSLLSQKHLASWTYTFINFSQTSHLNSIIFFSSSVILIFLRIKISQFMYVNSYQIQMQFFFKISWMEYGQHATPPLHLLRSSCCTGAYPVRQFPIEAMNFLLAYATPNCSIKIYQSS